MGKKGRSGVVAADEPKDSTPSINGCPIPLKKGCIMGLPLPTEADGLKMICNNEACPFKNQLVHQKCLETLEETLIKGLEQTGSARGWSDSQRKSNLWGRRGLPLVQRNCRCPCDHGFSVLDITAMEVAQIQAARDAGVVLNVNNVAKKKKKNSNLPALNTGKGKDANRKVEKRLLERDHFREDDVVTTVKTDIPTRNVPEPAWYPAVVESIPPVNPWTSATRRVSIVEPTLKDSISGSFADVLKSKDEIVDSTVPLNQTPPISPLITTEVLYDEFQFAAESVVDFHTDAEAAEEIEENSKVSLAEFITLKTSLKSKKGKKRLVDHHSPVENKEKCKEELIPLASSLPLCHEPNNPWYTDDRHKQKIYECLSTSNRRGSKEERIRLEDLTINTDVMRPITPSTPSSIQSDLLAECREAEVQPHVASECEYEDVDRLAAELEPSLLSARTLKMEPPPGFEHLLPPPGFAHIQSSGLPDALPNSDEVTGIALSELLPPVNSPETENHANYTDGGIELESHNLWSESMLPPSTPMDSSSKHYLNDFLKKRMERYAQGTTYDGFFGGPSFFLGEALQELLQSPNQNVL